jgi:mannose-6-phosphate isomerase-like protein (cupin superfamily)
VLVAAVDDSPLSLEDRRLGARETFTFPGGEHDSLLYVHAGAGSLTLAGETYPLEPRSAALVLAGEPATLTGEGGGVSFVCGLVGPTADLHAPLGERQVVARIDGDGAGSATGARSYEILFGPGNGSTRATLFLGFVPPGKAPWHFHQYDEIVWIPEGPGHLHMQDHDEELGAGSAFRLRPRQVHIVENIGSSTLELIGLFTPAGSPSAAYLA